MASTSNSVQTRPSMYYILFELCKCPQVSILHWSQVSLASIISLVVINQKLVVAALNGKS